MRDDTSSTAATGAAAAAAAATSSSIAGICMVQVKRDIYRGIVECAGRGLMHGAKWLAELNHGIDMTVASNQRTAESGTPSATATATTAPATSTATTKPAGAVSQPLLTDADRAPPLSGVASLEADAYYMAKSFFDCREYSRSAHFTRNCQSPLPHFLHLYATYMAREKRRLDSLTDSSNLHQPATNTKDVTDLVHELRALHAARKLDGYGMYLFGVVLKRIDLPEAAVRVLSEAVRNTPTLWSAWFELAPLITDREKLARLDLPDHWMRHIFTAHCLVDLFQNDEGLQMFEELQAVGFVRSTYITSQMAIAYHNKRNVDKAIAIFQHIQEIDPFRLENLDIFSNLLFVKEMKKEMAFLAHRAVEINKYRPETCCVIGNYYSIRSEHQKAIVYFQRALKLDPQYLSAWTLMGHEFMEMKNTNAAIQSYRKTVEVSRRDYRAWYGLGQAYEILKMPSFSIYYYKIAQQLRPYDSRMLVALGETYEKLEKHSNALRCFRKACNVGDIEGIALLRLADLHKKLGDIEVAVPAYLEFCSDERAAVDKQALCRVLVTLGNYYESCGMYEQASHFAYRCLEYDDTKLEARSLLKTIENNRALCQQLRPFSVVAGIAPRQSTTPASMRIVSETDSGIGGSTVSAATTTTTTTTTTTSSSSSTVSSAASLVQPSLAAANSVTMAAAAAADANAMVADDVIDLNEISMDQSDMVLEE